LILGKGITALASIRCLGRRGIPLYVGGTTDALLTRSRWYRPLPGSLGAEIADDDLEARLSALDVGRMVLLPTSDRWVTVVSRLRPELAARFPSSVAPPEILHRLVDKGSFARAVAELDVPHPRTSILREPGALRALSPERLRGSFLKPTKSGPFATVYGVKAIRFDDLEHAVRLYDDAAARGFEMMLQEYIPGPATRHCFVEGFIDRGGRLCGMLARRRLRMYPSDFGNSTATETIPLSDVAGAVEGLTRLLRGIDYRGVFSAEFKHDERDGAFKILEVNARPWWFAGFAARCGLDVCHMAYRDALGEPVEPVTDYAVGRRCIAPRLDLEAGLAEWRAGRSGLWTFLRSWIGASQLTLSLDDPRPSLGPIWLWIRNRLRRKLGW
jgi:predicted ATP-grasp superfamily ATP-dependent carboligase